MNIRFRLASQHRWQTATIFYWKRCVPSMSKTRSRKCSPPPTSTKRRG